MQQQNVHIASLPNVAKMSPPFPLESSAEHIFILTMMRMPTQHVCTNPWAIQSAVEWNGMIPSTLQAALLVSSALQTPKKPRFLQVRPIVRANLTLFWVCPIPVLGSLVAHMVRRRREQRTASDTSNTTASRYSIKASTHYPSPPSEPCWQTIDSAHTSDTVHSKQCTKCVQLCASTFHKERSPRSFSRT